jgi:hypothetical protein
MPYVTDYNFKRIRNWPKIKEKIETLWVESLRGRMEIHHTVFPSEGSACRRYWITLDGEIVWDFPKPFYGTSVDPPPRGAPINKAWEGEHEVDRMLLAYLSAPRAMLMETFVGVRRYSYLSKNPPTEHLLDQWDLGDMLRAADKRLGYTRLMYWAFFELDGGSPARKVLSARFENRKTRR